MRAGAYAILLISLVTISVCTAASATLVVESCNIELRSGALEKSNIISILESKGYRIGNEHTVPEQDHLNLYFKETAFLSSGRAILELQNKNFSENKFLHLTYKEKCKVSGGNFSICDNKVEQLVARLPECKIDPSLPKLDPKIPRCSRSIQNVAAGYQCQTSKAGVFTRMNDAWKC